MSEKPPKGFPGAMKKAAKIAQDTKRAADVVNKARDKAKNHSGRIEKMRDDLESLFRMLSHWIKGDYKKVPMQTIVFALTAIVYFLNPLDIVHDYLPLAGYLDDATVIAFVLRSIRQDLDEFLIWEKHK